MNDRKRVAGDVLLLFSGLILLMQILTKTQCGCHPSEKTPVNLFKQPGSALREDKTDAGMTQPYMADIPGALKAQSEINPPAPSKPGFLLPAIAEHSNPVALFAVNEDNTWLFATAVPIAARVRQLGKTPILLALSPELAGEQKRLLQRLESCVGSCTILSVDPNGLYREMPLNYKTKVLHMSSEPVEAGLFLAGAFWEQNDSVVVSMIEDPEATIFGSALAAHCGIPYIPITGEEAANLLSEKLRSLAIKSITFVTSDSALRPGSLCFPKQEVELLNIQQVQERMINKIGRSNVRNIILFPVHNKSINDNSSSWVAPLLSLIRSAPLVPCHSEDAVTAEQYVDAFIKKFMLKPHTVTILGDYDSIGLITTSHMTEPGEYELQMEPCASSVGGMAVELGVGRIPFRRLCKASTLIARNTARGYLTKEKEPRVLMIANPNTQYGPLPLCETISRATAEEFKNKGMNVDEFYGMSVCAPAVVRSIRDSQLVIFEGHITDFTLFETPFITEDEEYIHTGEFSDPDDGFVEVEELLPEQTPDSCDRDSWQEVPVEVRTVMPLPGESMLFDPENDKPNFQLLTDEMLQPADPCELDGIPLIIIQSCHSLDDSTLPILTSGAAAVIGSVTSIHSASGSAFIKAFCDGLLYRGETVGEALRDARNYMLCVAALKTERGHKEQAKVNRVAHSFHLWGDPEMKLFEDSPARLHLPAVSAEFVAPDKIRIITPRRRLPTSKTSEYVLRTFARGQVAGIVKRLKTTEARIVMPMYFFRMPLPHGFTQKRYISLENKPDERTRAVFLTEPFERFIYVLYFPSRDKMEQSYILEFQD